MLRADDAAAGTVKQTVLGRQHDDRYGAEYLVVLDERTGLIAVQARHHDVDEHNVRLVIRDLGERIEAVDRGEDLTPLFRQQRLRGTADRLAVIDNEYLQTLELGVAAGHAERTPYFEEGTRVHQPHAKGKRSAFLTYRCTPCYAVRVTFSEGRAAAVRAVRRRGRHIHRALSIIRR